MVEVTDHAVVRYAERCLHLVECGDIPTHEAMAVLRRQGIDIAAIRFRLRQIGAFGHRYGAPVVLADGVRVCMREGAVITVLERWMIGTV